MAGEWQGGANGQSQPVIESMALAWTTVVGWMEWYSWVGSNHRPPVPPQGALPNQATTASVAGPEKGLPNGAETRCNARLWQGRCGRHWDAGMVDQAAGLNSFDALALIGSTVSAATFWLNSASSLAWAVTASYCFLACEVHRSIASHGDLTPSSSCAKSSDAVVLAFIIFISLAEYSL